MSDDDKDDLGCGWLMLIVFCLAILCFSMIMKVRIEGDRSVDMEAIRAGLVQNKEGHWVKP